MPPLFDLMRAWHDLFMLFGTASWDRTVEPTGIRSQLPEPQGSGRCYGDGLWTQQWLAFGRIIGRLHSNHSAAAPSGR